LAEEKGIRIIHLWDYQIDKNPNLIKSFIMHLVNKSQQRLMARNTQLTELSPAEYRNFLDANHLQGSMNSKFKYGLLHDQQLVAVMGFGQSRFNKNTTELHRFSIMQNTSVIGAAGKLFKHFLKEMPTISKIETFALRDISQGNLYKMLDFEKISETSPNYIYFKNRVVYNRIKFQKHKLKKQLDYFDSSITEWENMKNNGYNRFWDTGNIKYEYKR
jgi:hypothetical protein